MPGGPLLRQLSRIYNRSLETPADARAAIAASPGVLASALFLEAAASDDVTSTAAANGYLESRLAELASFTDASTGEIRRQFNDLVARWDDAP